MNFQTVGLIEIAWIQFWQLAVVALMVALVTRQFCKERPHLAYLLWVLVLINVSDPILPAW